MKILVTGSTGFIGGVLCRGLVEAGHEVRAFHRASSNLRLLEGLPVEHVIGDLTQPDSVLAAMAGVEAVFHVGAWVGMNDPGRLYAITVEGTRAVIRAAMECKVRRMVYTSSVAAMGFPQSGIPSVLNENHTWNFRPELFPYGYAKYLAELEIQKAVAQGLDAVIVNPSMVLGAGDLYRVTSSVIVQIMTRRIGLAVEGGANVVHIADVVDGQIAAMERGKTGERYILGGTNLTYLDLVGKIAQVTNVPAPTVVLPGGLVRGLRNLAGLIDHFIELPVTPDVFVLAGRYLYYDTSKAHEQLGLAEPRPVEQAIAEAQAWFKHEGQA